MGKLEWDPNFFETAGTEWVHLMADFYLKMWVQGTGVALTAFKTWNPRASPSYIDVYLYRD